MKRLAVSTIALALALSSPVLAQNAETAESRIRADVTFLADDAVEGRRSGERGYDLAALYVHTRMEAMGLTAGGPDGAWLQPMTLAARRIAPEGAKVTWTPRDGAPVVWTHGTQLAVTPGVDAGHVTQSAEVVFVGYGLDAPELGMNDYEGLDVRGKIVVALSGVPTGLTGEPAAYLGDSKRRTAAVHGAVGYITLPKSDQALSSFDRTVAFAARQTSRTWVGADGKPHADAEGVIVGASVGPESGAALFAGAPKSYAEIRAEAAGQGARPKGFPLAGSIAFDVHTVREDIRTANVVGRIQGSDPALSDEVVLLSAHLDHLGISESGEGDRINNGALDNAGGVSIMLEAARSLAAAPPRRSVLVVALAAEEMGLIGSDFIAQNPVVAADKVVANVNLDMPILTYDFTDLVAFGSDHSTLGPLVDRAARAENLTLSPDPMPEQGIFTRSDHYSFVKAGVPSVMLATGYANGGEAQWDAFFANGYHRPADDLSMPFSWAAATRFARVNAAIARAIADADQRPLWYRGDVFGDRFAPDADKATPPSTE